MKTEKSCGAVVFKRCGREIRYVIICSKEGFFGFPKGHMECGESEKKTARREIKEETGLDVTFTDGFRTTDEHPHVRNDKPTVMKHMVYFLAEYRDGELHMQESELSGIKLMSYEEAMSALQFESSKRILSEADTYLKNHLK